MIDKIEVNTQNSIRISSSVGTIYKSKRSPTTFRWWEKLFAGAGFKPGTCGIAKQSDL